MIPELHIALDSLSLIGMSTFQMDQIVRNDLKRINMHQMPLEHFLIALVIPSENKY